MSMTGADRIPPHTRASAANDRVTAARRLAERITGAFSLATADAVRAHAAAGVATVGVDRDGNIVSRAPDGTKTVVHPA